MITLEGSKAYLKGSRLVVGSYAPRVYVLDQNFDGIAVGGSNGKYQVISVIPSIDGGVCQTQTKKFYSKLSQMNNVDLFAICSDTPFAIKRFYADNEINVNVLSDFRGKKFGNAYGLILENTIFQEMLTRAVIVIDPNGKIIYQEIVSEIANEPDYDKALKSLQ